MIFCFSQTIFLCVVQQSQILFCGPFSITLFSILDTFGRHHLQILFLLWVALLLVRVNDQKTGSEEAKEGASRGHNRNDTHAADGVHHRSEGRCNQNLADVDLEEYKIQNMEKANHRKHTGLHLSQKQWVLTSYAFSHYLSMSSYLFCFFCVSLFLLLSFLVQIIY